MNAGFLKRLLAYLIDIVIVSLIVSIVTMGISSTKTENLQKQLAEVQNNYISGELSMDDYVDSSTSLMYEMEKSSAVSTTINIVIMIGYFIIFQYLNKGQTLGKKLLKIKITEKGKEPKLITVIIRSLLIDGILINLIGVLLVISLNDYAYVMVYGIFSMLYMLFILISLTMMLFRNDKVALHDIITRSNVVEV